MKHTKITVGFATLLCIFSLAGCQGKPQNQPVKAETEMQQTGAVSEPQTEQAQQESSETHPNNVPANAEELLDSATTSGEVTAFSDTGLTLNPLSVTDAGAAIMAVDSENAENLLTVHYLENCTFQLARINQSTGALALETASAADIKKETSIAVYGEADESGAILAKQIFLIRYE